MEQHFVEEPCQEGWHRPVLSLFAKVFTVFSCKLPKQAVFSKKQTSPKPVFVRQDFGEAVKKEEK